jgi:hypothetical protein
VRIHTHANRSREAVGKRRGALIGLLKRQDRYLPTIRPNGECRKLRTKPLERGTHAGRCIVCTAVKGREAAQNEGYLLLRLALTLSAPVTYGRSGPDEASL